MVFLSKIYTKSGDQGETGLGDGSRVAKDHPRVEAYGRVDELNAALGLLVLHLESEHEVTLIRGIQNDLFDVGADLCVPPKEEEDASKALRTRPAQVARLEREIDRINASLEPLTSFVLPGGSPASAWCHLARTSCRAAERAVVTLASRESINPVSLIYLNRLSDLLFVMARAMNNGGKADILWQPLREAKE